MQFTWDPAKNRRNKAKHAIDFETAKLLWNDENRIEIHAPHPVESRWIVIGRIEDKLWTGIYTMRSADSYYFGTALKRKGGCVI